MIGFKTEFGLQNNSGHIALTRANLSQGQLEVTRSSLNVFPSATNHPANASRNWPVLEQSQESQALSGIRCSKLDKNPHPQGWGYTDKACEGRLKITATLSQVDWVLEVLGGNLVSLGLGSSLLVSGSV